MTEIILWLLFLWLLFQRAVGHGVKGGSVEGRYVKGKESAAFRTMVRSPEPEEGFPGLEQGMGSKLYSVHLLNFP